MRKTREKAKEKVHVEEKEEMILSVWSGEDIQMSIDRRRFQLRPKRYDILIEPKTIVTEKRTKK